ncbi:hypothetical protein FOXG_19499 [Fusarium oxysporum f. sp. lycopersici 4287]|uniref:Uncharacterized protein n=1 Tax=Fusarium oxysporum f. sp. lycopersici (strain 4287 / CBS 123668 / FGSC 9935 / NRRL 34936) TaxID=426428 RepID=A0A0J9V1Y4_FUSO4|nr:hypothetical protein FOXG_19499 [Fusarium oxysporum f. sp. lycopersici 4287]KNB05163.1 hypothetical protein FOXG_19499 [Fusarium oxysporum f. sp. lycopersici 4287]
MEQHHVHHHHHHHYHYYYNHPFPPGLPPNAQGNGEPLNPEAAGRDDDEPSAEEDGEHKQKNKPRQSSHITVTDKARIVATDRGFRVVNCDPSGLQVDICWRVPGQRNIWLARLRYAGWSRKKLRTLIGAQASPDMSFFSYLEAPLDEEKALSLIECSSSDRAYDDFERGDGQIVIGDPGSLEFVSAFGRLVGFEVLRG